jgi:hypothetical protein
MQNIRLQQIQALQQFAMPSHIVTMLPRIAQHQKGCFLLPSHHLLDFWLSTSRKRNRFTEGDKILLAECPRIFIISNPKLTQVI